jgi:hypothetical protein
MVTQISEHSPGIAGDPGQLIRCKLVPTCVKSNQVKEYIKKWISEWICKSDITWIRDFLLNTQ